jgi:hypothetical protein
MTRRQELPHSPTERLHHFLETADDYVEFSACFPLPLKLVVGQPERDRWTVVAHAMMLRKYFSGDPSKPGSGDALNLTAVIHALRESLHDSSISDEEWNRVEAKVRITESTTRFMIQGVERPAHQILEEELYSRYLHGEAGKRRRRSDSQSFADHALWRITHDRSVRVQRVAAVVRDKVRAGLVTLE